MAGNSKHGETSKSARRTPAARRPPAIAPKRLVRVDRPKISGAVPPPTRNLSSDLPPVVLRLPEIQYDEPGDLLSLTPDRKTGRQRTVMAVVAAVVVLLAVVLFRGGSKKELFTNEPSHSTPAWQTTDTPSHQPVPAWSEPVVALPKVESVAPLESQSTVPLLNWHRDPAGENADGPLLNAGPQSLPPTFPSLQPPQALDTPANLRVADAAGRTSTGSLPDVVRPSVRFDGTIDKNPLETRYDGTRSGPY